MIFQSPNKILRATNHPQQPAERPNWNTYGVLMFWSYSGISTFAHLKHVKCLVEPDVAFDIGIIGAPFDTAVSYRTGARFGPRAIRLASARQSRARGWNARAAINPYKSGLRVVDCGDIPLVPIDNGVALRQMTEAMLELGSRPSRPRLLTLGGDHSVALGALRALRQVYGQPITLVHFDAHLDTWKPPNSASDFPWFSEQGRFNHGDVFALAWEEGLIANDSSVHVGLRTRLSGLQDIVDDDSQGFIRINSDDIDVIGTDRIIKRVKERVGTGPVYLSFDIDVVDPGLAPGTGTPEVGGFTSREVIRLLRGLEGIDIVGADIVEVSPQYDGPGEQTSLVAAQVAYEILTNWAIILKEQ
ncbi:putative guanidinobutyrase [Colletotrichum sublineola]|uniref:Putative guanidinobutyrase n=1 Tax=Colletotrichum sublineola TaxID=1173701 RepID=A0A066WTP5_COLSU|nr:putative guanidinobutyrase [Colletotrichum sublineola]